MGLFLFIVLIVGLLFSALMIKLTGGLPVEGIPDWYGDDKKEV